MFGGTWESIPQAHLLHSSPDALAKYLPSVRGTNGFGVFTDVLPKKIGIV